MIKRRIHQEDLTLRKVCASRQSSEMHAARTNRAQERNRPITTCCGQAILGIETLEGHLLWWLTPSRFSIGVYSVSSPAPHYTHTFHGHLNLSAVSEHLLLESHGRRQGWRGSGHVGPRPPMSPTRNAAWPGLWKIPHWKRPSTSNILGYFPF